MIVVAGIMFYNYSQSQKILFLVLMAFAMVFVAIYFYRIFAMRIVFEEDKLTFKGLATQHTILKKDITNIFLLQQVGREISKVKYIKGADYRSSGAKTYVLITKDATIFPTNISMFSASSDEYITLEYTPGIEKYLDKLLS